MPEKMVHVYDTRTGAKIGQRVPEVWLKVFPHLSLTPKQKNTPRRRKVEETIIENEES